jgi:hypothetical protein
MVRRGGRARLNAPDSKSARIIPPKSSQSNEQSAFSLHSLLRSLVSNPPFYLRKLGLISLDVTRFCHSHLIGSGYQRAGIPDHEIRIFKTAPLRTETLLEDSYSRYHACCRRCFRRWNHRIKRTGCQVWTWWPRTALFSDCSHLHSLVFFYFHKYGCFVRLGV